MGLKRASSTLVVAHLRIFQMLSRIFVFFGLLCALGMDIVKAAEPYTVIHVQMEEGVKSAAEAQRAFEEGASEKTRVAELAEEEVRGLEKMTAILASQKVQAAKIADMKAKLH